LGLFRRIVVIISVSGVIVVFSVISVVVVFSIGGIIVVIIIALLALLALVCFLLRVFRLFLLVFRRCRSHLCLRRRRALRQTSRDARALPAATVARSTGVRQPLGAVTQRQNLPRRSKSTISLAT
jgi:hypothetical protein